jgi:hypothetical protein
LKTMSNRSVNTSRAARPYQRENEDSPPDSCGFVGNVGKMQATTSNRSWCTSSPEPLVSVGGMSLSSDEDDEDDDVYNNDRLTWLTRMRDRGDFSSNRSLVIEKELEDHRLHCNESPTAGLSPTTSSSSSRPSYRRESSNVSDSGSAGDGDGDGVSCAVGSRPSIRNQVSDVSARSGCCEGIDSSRESHWEHMQQEGRNRFVTSHSSRSFDENSNRRTLSPSPVASQVAARLALQREKMMAQQQLAAVARHRALPSPPPPGSMEPSRGGSTTYRNYPSNTLNRDNGPYSDAVSAQYQAQRPQPPQYPSHATTVRSTTPPLPAYFPSPRPMVEVHTRAHLQ